MLCEMMNGQSPTGPPGPPGSGDSGGGGPSNPRAGGNLPRPGRPNGDGLELSNYPDRGRRPPRGDPPPPGDPPNPPDVNDNRGINDNHNNNHRPPDDPDGDDPGDDHPPCNPRRIANEAPKNKASAIALPALPPPAGFYFWRGLVRDAVSAAYESNPDSAHNWILEVEDPNATIDSIEVCAVHFSALDAKLAEAINVIILARTDDLTRQINNMKESFVKSRRVRMKGRQMLFLVYAYYRVDPSSGVLFEVEDLGNAELHQDKLAEFLAVWDNILIHMRRDPDADLKTALFLKEVKKPHKMKEHVKNYLVAPVGSNEKTNDYLYACATDVVERERHDSNRRNRQNREYDVGRFHYSNKNHSRKSRITPF
jgi:hypothetical protein